MKLMELFSLLLLSIPIFYLIGFIKFISWFFRDDKHHELKDPNEAQYLERVIHELSSIVKTQPMKTVQDVMQQYQEKLANLSQAKPGLQVHKSEQQKDLPLLHKDVGNIWQNWYTHNSINLLLYLGAFLIVMSASIFVSFQWETISGVTKASLLCVLALTFFICGLWFHRVPKIQTAGATFISIGAILLPICGSAWYTFVFKAQGYSPGPIWLITSILSLILYVSLATYFKNIFYVYIANIATLSLLLSVVRTYDLPTNYYILHSIFTSILLLGISYTVKNNHSLQSLYYTPVKLSSHVIMPLSLIYGLLIAISDGMLFSVEVTVSLLLGSLFYLISYFIEKSSWKIATAELLIPFSVFVHFYSRDYPTVLLLFAISAIGLLYILFAYLFKKDNLPEESDISTITGIMLLILSALTVLATTATPEQKAFLTLLPAIAGSTIAYIKRRIQYTHISAVFFALFLFIVHTDIFKLENHYEYLGMTYAFLGLAYYLATVWHKHTQPFVQTFALSSSFYFVLGLLASLGHNGYLGIIFLLLAAIAISASREFGNLTFVYGSNTALYFSLLCFLRQSNIRELYFPIFFVLCAYFIYSISLNVSAKIAPYYRTSALFGGILTFLLLCIPSIEGYGHPYDMQTEKFALVATYGLMVLFGIDAYRHRSSMIGYITSAFGIFTYLWHLSYLGFTETLLYTLPLGVYFMVLAYLRRLKKDPDNMHFLDSLGMLFLLGSPAVLSFGENAMKYSVILGIEGIILLMLGISMQYKVYRYAGIAAIVLSVLPQSYEYIAALPRWAVVGVFGIGFLGTALTLLLKKKDE